MIRLIVPGTLRFRDLAVRAVAAAAKLVDADREFDDEVVSAFGEAFNNVALHAYEERAGDLEIEIDVADRALTIRLLDYGTSFEVADIPDPDLDSLPESGMGLFIIRSFVDELSYRPGTPNLLTMTKRYQA